MASSYNGTPLPAGGSPITFKDGKLQIPDNPIIPYIEGDGTGRDIWAASVRVFDAAVEKAYGGKRKIQWYEVFAGEKAFTRFNDWLPQGTVDAIKRPPRRHQRTADDTCRRRHSLAERRPSSDPRSLFLHSSREVLPGRAFAGETS